MRGHLSAPVDRTCKGCDVAFSTTVARRLYCEPRCKGRATERGRVRKTSPRRCAGPGCGREFLARADRPTAHCSYACATRAKHAAGVYTDPPRGAEHPAWRGGAVASKRRRLYGLTSEQHDAMLAEQGGGCALCRRTPAENGKRLAVDHCHDTGLVRGLLCSPCNYGLGLLGDDVAGLRAALDYVAARVPSTA